MFAVIIGSSSSHLSSKVTYCSFDKNQQRNSLNSPFYEPDIRMTLNNDDICLFTNLCGRYCCVDISYRKR